MADTPLHQLTEQRLGSWLDSRPTDLAPFTIRRLVNDFRAALNAAGDLPLIKDICATRVRYGYRRVHVNAEA